MTLPAANSRTFPLATLVVVALAGLAACEAPPAQTQNAAALALPKAPARIDTFALSAESLHIDKVGMRGGAVRPDGSLDFAFTMRINGPARVLYLSTANEKCEAQGGFRATTASGDEPAPAELGGALELGRMSAGIAVEEGGKFVNADNGAVLLAPGPHDLKLYVSNLGTLRAGLILCAYAVGGDGVLAHGPPLTY